MKCQESGKNEFYRWEGGGGGGRQLPPAPKWGRMQLCSMEGWLFLPPVKDAHRQGKAATMSFNTFSIEWCQVCLIHRAPRSDPCLPTFNWIGMGNRPFSHAIRRLHTHHRSTYHFLTHVSCFLWRREYSHFTEMSFHCPHRIATPRFSSGSRPCHGIVTSSDTDVISPFSSHAS